jgi:hypothetical protein
MKRSVVIEMLRTHVTILCEGDKATIASIVERFFGICCPVPADVDGDIREELSCFHDVLKVAYASDSPSLSDLQNAQKCLVYVQTKSLFLDVLAMWKMGEALLHDCTAILDGTIIAYASTASIREVLTSILSLGNNDSPLELLTKLVHYYSGLSAMALKFASDPVLENQLGNALNHILVSCVESWLGVVRGYAILFDGAGAGQADAAIANHKNTEALCQMLGFLTAKTPVLESFKSKYADSLAACVRTLQTLPRVFEVSHDKLDLQSATSLCEHLQSNLGENELMQQLDALLLLTPDAQQSSVAVRHMLNLLLKCPQVQRAWGLLREQAQSKSRPLFDFAAQVLLAGDVELFSEDWVAAVGPDLYENGCISSGTLQLVSDATEGAVCYTLDQVSLLSIK